MAVKSLLGFVALNFLVLGAVYAFNLHMMIEASGMQIPTGTSQTDAMAMYAGIQIGLRSLAC